MSTYPRQDAPQSSGKEQVSRRKQYAFFSVGTPDRVASVYGHCSGQVNLQTGEILACISYGLYQYRETRHLSLSDRVRLFPCTTEEFIILEARRVAGIENI